MKKYFLLVLGLGLVLPSYSNTGIFRKKKKSTADTIATVAKPKHDFYAKGLFDVTRVGTDWFFEIPDSLLGREILTTTRYFSTPASSGKFGGELLNEQTLYWEKSPLSGNLLLRASLLVNTSDSTQNINRAITVSNENPIIGTFKIESHSNGKYKVKVTSFFNEDNPSIGMPVSTKKAFGLTSQLAPLSFISDIKSFPMNTEVRLVKTWNSGSGTLPAHRAAGRVTFGINISFILLPEKPMMRRYFDPRVGYFTDQFNYFSDSQQRVENKRFITRWRLEPKPEDVEKMRRGELVEPQKPIVFYIDPATPEQWKKYLIQGVNDWQAAFEKAGFKNAIIGKEWPENDSTMSMEDARFSMIRYLASPISNAYGPHVHDPRSGEILESHICWYHNVMNLLHDWYMIQASTLDEAARKMNFDEELMGELIRFVSSHEVGHTLGLRHNFGASATVPVDSLRDRTWVEKYGHTPSIMDYARFNYVAQPQDSVSRRGIFPRINDYDMWAIEWGYRPMLDATDEDSDRELLENLFVKNAVARNKRLWFGDGETNPVSDPRCQTEDLGDNSMKASEYGIMNLKRQLDSLPEWTYDKKDIYNSNLKSVYTQIRIQFMRYNNHVINNIGGYFNNFRTVDEPGDVYTPVSREQQKEAMQYVDRNIFTEPEWLISQDYMRRMSWDPQSYTLSVGTSAMGSLFAALSRLNDEYKADEYLTDMSDMLFREISSRKSVTPYRAGMQTNFVSRLATLYTAGMPQANYRPAVLSLLKKLRTRTATASANMPDKYSRDHFANLNDIITRALEIK